MKGEYAEAAGVLGTTESSGSCRRLLRASCGPGRSDPCSVPSGNRITRRTGHRRASSAALALLPLLLNLEAVAGDPDASAPASSAPFREARALIDAGHYREARDTARGFLSREEATAVDASATAAVLDLLVEASWREGVPSDGLLDSARRAVRIREGLVDGHEGELAASLDNLCAAQRLLGDLGAARQTCERSVAVREQALRPEHPDVADGLNGLALVLIDLGKYADARPVCDRALALREASRDRKPLDVAESLTTLGTLLRWTSDFAGARLAYERALAIREQTLPSDHPLLAQAVHNIGVVRYLGSDNAAARPWIERALAMRTRAFGSEHPETAVSLTSHAALLLATGELPSARSDAEASLRIREQVFGVDHKLTSSIRLLLGRILAEQRELPAAESVFARALESVERTLGSDHPRVADILAEMGVVASLQGDFARASRFGERALTIREKAFGRDDSKVATSLLFLLAPAWAEERYDVVLDRSLRAARIAREHAWNMARHSSEREALRFVEAWRPALEQPVSAIAEPGLPRLPSDATTKVWDEIIRGRALVLDEMAARHRFALDIADAETTALVRSLDDARRRLSVLMAADPEPANPGLFSKRLRLAREDEERSERALALKVSGARDEELQRGVTFQQVAAALPPNAALLAYVQLERWFPPVEGERRSLDSMPHVPSYFALVLRSGGAPVAVALGASAEIDARVRLWRKQVSSAPTEGTSDRRYRSAGKELREVIWDPVARRLSGVDQVFVVAEGTINLVNLATLPIGNDRYLLEEGRLLHYLSAERDLVRLSTIPPPAPATDGLLLFGGPDYDSLNVDRTAVSATRAPSPISDRLQADPDRRDAPTAYRGPRSTCASFSGLTFDPLPGALAEVNEIRALWDAPRTSRPGRSGVVEVFTGSEADESTFKAVAPRHRIVHLATHAFFAADDCGDTSAGAASRSSDKPEMDPAIFEENPLLLAGLAFAGANGRDNPAARRRQDDGVLTAEEIASLDLRGVEWVVLSACGTGIGPIETGEGVMGLRRTFQIAGARSVIMSLWSIDDHSARDWSRRLYGSRLSGRSTTESVRDASLGLLEARRRAGVTTHPFSWGAFVAVGDWR